MRMWCVLTDSGSNSKINPCTGLLQDQRVRPSAVRPGHLYLREIFVVLMTAKGWVDPTATVHPEWWYQWHQLESNAGTCGFLPQCLNQLRNRVTQDLVVTCPFVTYGFTKVPNMSQMCDIWSDGTMVQKCLALQKQNVSWPTTFHYWY